MPPRASTSTSQPPTSTSSSHTTTATAASTSSTLSASKDVPRITLMSTLDEFDIWRARFCAYLGREKPELFQFAHTDVQPDNTANTLFACQLLPFVGDDFLTRYRRQLNCVTQGVDLYRAIVAHFSSAAPAEDLAEEIFLRGLVRDKFSSINDFMREAQSLLLTVERVSGEANSTLERTLSCSSAMAHTCPSFLSD